MNHTELLDRCKCHELNSISIGLSRIDIVRNNVVVYGKATNLFKNNTAEILLFFYDSANENIIRILISCHCVWNSSEWFFKLKVDEVLESSNISPSSTLEVKGWITEFILYETDSHDNSLDYNKEEYLSDALIINFSDHKVLSIISCMGDDEHEPSMWIKYFDNKHVDMRSEFRMEKWTVRGMR